MPLSALFERRDSAALAAFRALYGALVTVSAVRFFVYGWIDEFFVTPRFFFHYWGTAWLMPERPGASTVHVVMAALGVLGVLVTLGVCTRIALLALVLSFTWLQALDVTNYLNHYVLVSLLGLLMACMPIGEAYSVDAWWSSRKSARPSFVGQTTLPAWCTWLLRLQVGVVYFYAGLAKLGSDWLLHAQPLNIWLTSRTSYPVLGPLFAQPWVAFAFAWAGFLFDTSIVLWLSLRRTRPFAYVALLGFHAMTGWLFPIGMFPMIMSVAALIFFPADWPRSRRSLSSLAGPPTRSQLATARLSLRQRAGVALGVAYAIVQLLLPLRTHLYGGNVLWHEQGMRFSWRVMVREKNASVTYLVHEPATGRRWHVAPRDYLDARQEREFATQPDLIWQLAQRIATDERRRGRDVEVRVDAIASLNGRAPHRLIDPEVDLGKVADTLATKPWILPAPTEPPPWLAKRR